MEIPLSKFERVPIADIDHPEVARICYPPSWWIVSPDREVFFFRPNHTSPQCNDNRLIVDRWLPRFPGCTVEQLPMVYLKHNCNDYV